MEIVFRVIANVLELANNVIRTESDRARGERRQSGNSSQFVFRKQLLDDLEHVASTPIALLAFLNRGLRTVRLQLHVGPRT